MDQTLPDLAPGAAPPAPASAPSRRQVLALVAVTGAGGVLITACGGGGDDTTTPGSGGSSSDASSDSPSPSDSAGGAPGSGLVATADVPVGGGVILDKQKVVVTQPARGTFKAFSAVCTHQSCIVGSVKDGKISCPCHGSAYSAKDGSVLNGPATRALAEVPVAVEGGQVVKS